MTSARDCDRHAMALLWTCPTMIERFVIQLRQKYSPVCDKFLESTLADISSINVLTTGRSSNFCKFFIVSHTS